MFAMIAAICFAIALFVPTMGTVGLFFLALHLAGIGPSDWRSRWWRR